MNDNNDKMRVYLSEFNIQMGNTVYIPYVSGLLRAFAETHDIIQAHYEFQPFVFIRDRTDSLVEVYRNPHVAGFSLSMWNEQYSLKLAREVKRRYPDCLIVFGGPQVPHYAGEYFAEYPFVDVAVRGEGETAFANILARFAESRSFDGIPGISWRDPDSKQYVRNDEENAIRKELDEYPSPYLVGLYEYLFQENPHLNFQAIVETNRGCPFPCTFCFWGQGGLNTRLRYHSVERVRAELEWAGNHQIRYVFNADANFGMYKQDVEIAKVLVETKRKYGFPEKFRTCFGKNSDDQIYEIARLMHAEKLEKGITLARQSNTTEVLENIRRKNIKLETYINLQTRFDEIKVPVYTEMILGLPGETYQTWVDGIEALLGTAIKNQLFIYLCQVYPNTELANPEYQKEFGIQTLRIPLNEIHGSFQKEDEVVEYEEIVIATNAMPPDDWRKAARFSWTTMAMHSMKLGYFIISYLAQRYDIGYTDFIRYLCDLPLSQTPDNLLQSMMKNFNDEIESILSGQGRGRILSDYGEIYWDQEEAVFLQMADQADEFFADLTEALFELLTGKGIDFDEDEVNEVIQYQRARIPSRTGEPVKSYVFNYNIPAYFDARFGTNPIPIEKKGCEMTASQKDYQGDKKEFARETVLWGRKSSTMLTTIDWRYLEMEPS